MKRYCGSDHTEGTEENLQHNECKIPLSAIRSMQWTSSTTTRNNNAQERTGRSREAVRQGSWHPASETMTFWKISPLSRQNSKSDSWPTRRAPLRRQRAQVSTTCIQHANSTEIKKYRATTIVEPVQSPCRLYAVQRCVPNSPNIAHKRLWVGISKTTSGN